MDKQVIISVGREYGSGGHYVAHKIANDLGIAYYDRSILDELAKEHNVSPEILEKYDETKGNPLLSRRVKGLSNSIDEILVEMQFDLLRKKAASGESFVIVGRCAEELFRGEERLVSIFVVADMEDRVKSGGAAQNQPHGGPGQDLPPRPGPEEVPQPVFLGKVGGFPGVRRVHQQQPAGH